jgi:glutathione synthase
MEEFYHQHKDVVIKPLYSFGGNEVKRINTFSEFNNTLPAYIKKHKHITIQKFLPAVHKGDKRVLMVDGEIIGALKRIPKQGHIAANLAAGGRAEPTELTVKEIEVCRKVGKFLKPRNLFLAGIDLLDGYLLEINVTSPTTFKTYNELYKTKIEQKIIDILLKKFTKDFHA